MDHCFISPELQIGFDAVKMELNAGFKNIFNSFQNDFDEGINRNPGYVYGQLRHVLFILG